MKQGHYRIMADRVDITARLADRFIDMRVTDAAGEESDRVSIRLDNRDDLLVFPETGAQLRIWIGQEGMLRDKGIYTVDEVSERLDDGELEITGSAFNLKGSIKAQKSRTWDGPLTLGTIAQRIAGEHGLACQVHESCKGISIGHQNQKAESDMNLLTRLVKKFGAMMKVGNGNILIVPKGMAVAADGTPLPVIEISDPSESAGRVTLQERENYAAIETSFFDEAEQRQVTVTVKLPGKEGPTKQLKGKHKDRATALAAAQAEVEALARGKAKMAMTRPLTPDIVAPGKVHVTGHRQSANGTWFVETAEHYVGSNGVSSTTLSLTTESMDVEKGKK